MARVIVAGSINMDVVVQAERHPRPGETVAGKSVQFFPGGKGANQAVASARHGARTEMRGAVGGDGFGEQLLAFLRDMKVNVSGVTVCASEASGTALIVVDDRGENTIVVVPGANGQLAPADSQRVDLQKGDVLLCQLESPLLAVEAFLRRGKAAKATTMLNAAPAMRLPSDVLSLVDVLVVNESELAALTGSTVTADDSDEQVESTLRGLQTKRDQVLIVTLGARGSIAVLGERVIRTPARKVAVVDTTGAGDCFTGTLAARIAAGEALDAGIRAATAAASICIQRSGAGPSMPTKAEVADVMSLEEVVG